MKIAFSIGLCLILGTLAGRCQGLVLDTTAYVLGVDDAVAITVDGMAELNAKTLGVIRIDHQGDLILPLAGRIHAGGLTVDGLEREIGTRLLGFMNRPEVSVAIAEYRSHPVSVLGAVRTPGVYQVTGLKSLYEVLSLAGGLGPDAGNTIKITRSASVAILPLPNVTFEKGGEFQVGQLNVRHVLAGNSPEKNIIVLANDVITVPKSDLVYVVGAVRRAGGYPVAEKEHLSVLQAISLAEGLDKVAGAKNARILRPSNIIGQRVEIKINVQDILNGHADDVPLQPNDILFVPSSLAKSAGMRAWEAAVQVGTGIVIFGL